MAEDVDARARKIAAQLEGLLDDGEKMLVTGKGAGIEVERLSDDGVTSRLKQTHPAVYGRLVAVEGELGRGGGIVTWALWIGAVALCVGMELGWWGHALDAYASVWFYGLLGLVTIFLATRIGAFFGAVRWARLRTTLLREIDDAMLDLPTAVAMIEGDAAVSAVARRLKRVVASGDRGW